MFIHCCQFPNQGPHFLRAEMPETTKPLTTLQVSKCVLQAARKYVTCQIFVPQQRKKRHGGSCGEPKRLIFLRGKHPCCMVDNFALKSIWDLPKPQTLLFWKELKRTKTSCLLALKRHSEVTTIGHFHWSVTFFRDPSLFRMKVTVCSSGQAQEGPQVSIESYPKFFNTPGESKVR